MLDTVSRGEGPAATILDVARRAGVSRTTVSRVLNEPELVTADTLKRVQDAAAALNFTPNRAARGLRSGRSGVIALLVGDIAQPFHGALAQAVAAAADRHGLAVMLYDLAHSETRLEVTLDRLSQQGVDAILIATADRIATPPVEEVVGRCIGRGIPVITGTKQFAASGVVAVDNDFAQCTRLAVDLLTRSGALHPVLLLGDSRGGVGSALHDGAAELDVLVTGYDIDAAAEAVRSLDAEVDALIVQNLPLALGAIAAMRDAGRELPVVLCEDVPLAAHMTPAFTTAAVSPARTGEELVRLAAAAIRGEVPRPEHLQPQLVVRASAR